MEPEVAFSPVLPVRGGFFVVFFIPRKKFRSHGKTQENEKNVNKWKIPEFRIWDLESQKNSFPKPPLLPVLRYWRQDGGRPQGREDTAQTIAQQQWPVPRCQFPQRLFYFCFQLVYVLRWYMCLDLCLDGTYVLRSPRTIRHLVGRIVL